MGYLSDQVQVTLIYLPFQSAANRSLRVPTVSLKRPIKTKQAPNADGFPSWEESVGFCEERAGGETAFRYQKAIGGAGSGHVFRFFDEERLPRSSRKSSLSEPERDRCSFPSRWRECRIGCRPKRVASPGRIILWRAIPLVSGSPGRRAPGFPGAHRPRRRRGHVARGSEAVNRGASRRPSAIRCPPPWPARSHNIP
jgi:hypothetical protein